jgi:hypothetical protein
VSNREVWEAEADRWLRWARAPRHDAYWYYGDASDAHALPIRGAGADLAVAYNSP